MESRAWGSRGGEGKTLLLKRIREGPFLNFSLACLPFPPKHLSLSRLCAEGGAGVGGSLCQPPLCP